MTKLLKFLRVEDVVSEKVVRDYIMVAIGAFIMAAGFSLFADPHKIVPGGAYGLAIVMHHTIDIPTGMGGIIINIPLFAIGVWILGATFGVKTVTGVILSSLFIDLQSKFMYLIPHMLNGKTVHFNAGDVIPDGAFPITDNIMLASIVCGVCLGSGLGIVFRAKATTGGSDIIAMVIEKYTKLPLGQLMIMVDSCIILVGIIAFGDLSLALYAIITLFISGRTIDAFLMGKNYHKAVFIVSEKHEEIRQEILLKMGRGGTYLSAQGMYQLKDKKVIFTAVARRQLFMLLDNIKRIDPNAFITIFNAAEVKGEGFVPISED